MQERRKTARARVHKRAKIILEASSVIDCVVRDLNNCGARIDVPRAVNLPENVDMTFDGGHSIRPCRLVWRTLDATGVKFLNSECANEC